MSKGEADVMDTYVCPTCQQTGCEDSEENQTVIVEQHWGELQRLVHSLQVREGGGRGRRGEGRGGEGEGNGGEREGWGRGEGRGGRGEWRGGGGERGGERGGGQGYYRLPTWERKMEGGIGEGERMSTVFR